MTILLNKVNKDLHKIKALFGANKIKLHLAKTNFMIPIYGFLDLHLDMGNNLFLRLNRIKFLSLIIDTNLLLIKLSLAAYVVHVAQINISIELPGISF